MLPSDPTTASANSMNMESYETEKDVSNEMESSHHLPARTLRGEDGGEQTQPSKDDLATMAASEELKHTTISDNVGQDLRVTEAGAEADSELVDDANHIKVQGTPEAENLDARNEEMLDRLSSPKKKRGRDQDEDAEHQDDDNGEDQTSSADGSVVNGSRSTRSEPEKKRRPRDLSEDFTKPEAVAELKVTSPNPQTTIGEEAKEKSSDSENRSTSAMPEDKSQTSKSAFASSGFASLASSSTSPFGSLGTSKPSVFGGNSQTSTSGFGALANTGSSTTTTTATLTGGFGGLSGAPITGFSFGGGSNSGFGAIGGNSVFGAKLGNGFAGGSGPKLSSFAAPGTETVPLGSKPTKAFGAPDSDEEGASDDEGTDENTPSDDEESTSAALEDKKKGKPKVQIDDGEAGETTLLQTRAKLFALESKDVGWKERGVGTLKINVPKSCASYDENGAPVPGSFDASGFEEDDAQSTPCVVRLIMRQENTHRVILNTVILSGMEFQDKPAASSVQILFTAFEGEKESKPISMLLKLSEANARMFRAEIDSIQRELSQ